MRLPRGCWRREPRSGILQWFRPALQCLARGPAAGRRSHDCQANPLNRRQIALWRGIVAQIERVIGANKPW